MKKTALLLTAILAFSAVSLYAQNAKTRIENGKKLYQQGDYDGAIRELTEAIRLAPKAGEAFLIRGTLYFAKKDYDRAIADYTEVIRLDPKETMAYIGRGDAYYYKKDYDRAITDYTEAIRLNPKDASLYSNRGAAYSKKDDYDRAIKDYEAALRIDPNNSNAKNNLAIAKREAAKQNDSSQSSTGVISVTAADLLSAYESNQLRSDAQYLNKTIKVTGKVVAVAKNDVGDYYIALDNLYVNVYFKPSELNKAIDLNKGQMVTLTGTCIGRPYVIIQIKDAVFSN